MKPFLAGRTQQSQIMQDFPTIRLATHRKRKDDVYSSTAGWLKVMSSDYAQHEGRQEMFTAFYEKRGRQICANGLKQVQ
jgi:hypothetical protein